MLVGLPRQRNTSSRLRHSAIAILFSPTANVLKNVGPCWLDVKIIGRIPPPTKTQLDPSDLFGCFFWLARFFCVNLIWREIQPCLETVARILASGFDGQSFASFVLHCFVSLEVHFGKKKGGGVHQRLLVRGIEWYWFHHPKPGDDEILLVFDFQGLFWSLSRNCLRHQLMALEIVFCNTLAWKWHRDTGIPLVLTWETYHIPRTQLTSILGS